MVDRSVFLLKTQGATVGVLHQATVKLLAEIPAVFVRDCQGWHFSPHSSMVRDGLTPYGVILMTQLALIPGVLDVAARNGISLHGQEVHEFELQLDPADPASASALQLAAGLLINVQ